VLTSW